MNFDSLFSPKKEPSKASFSLPDAKAPSKPGKSKKKAKPKHHFFLFLILWFATLIYIKDDGKYVPLTDRILKKLIPGYDSMSEQKRHRNRKKLQRKGKGKQKVRMKRVPSNSPRKVTFPDGTRRKATADDLHQGATALLSGLLQLFPSAAEGKRILAIIVCAMRCSHLRKRFPDFYPHLYINKGVDKLADVFTVLIECIITKREWKKKRITLNRVAILDFRSAFQQFRKKAIDFTKLTVFRKKKTILQMPAPYTDSIALVIGTEPEDVKEIAPYLENTGTVFLGGDKPKSAESAKVSQYNAYDPEALQSLRDNGSCIAAFLRNYWENDSNKWADRIAERVTAYLSRGDSGRYLSVRYKPVVLRNAVYDVVLEDFLAELLGSKILSEEECSNWMSQLWPVDTAQTEEDSQVLSPNDPNMFLQIVRKMIADNPDRIVDYDQPYRTTKNPLGAWRLYDKTDHFMMLEETFEKEFPKAAKALGNVDLTMFSHDWLHNY